MSVTFGSYTLANPKADGGSGMESVPVGVAMRSANGTWHADYVISKKQSLLDWEDLTQAERNSCWSAYAAYLATSATFTLPNAESFTAYTNFGSWRESHRYDLKAKIWLYNVSFGVVEA